MLLLDKPARRHKKRQGARKNFGEQDALARRTRRLLETEIDFIDNLEFRAVADTDFDDPAPKSNSSDSNRAASSTGTLTALCSAPLLTAEEERELFRRMNYVKYRANTIRQRLDDSRPDPAAVVEAENLLGQAEAIRNRLVRANMRLVVSVAKRLAGDRDTLEDLIEEGVFTLLRAIERFDYDRGFRFSTYATRALHRQFVRTVQRRRQDLARCQSSSVDQYSDESAGRSASAFTESRWEMLTGCLRSMLSKLDQRERAIVRARFALGGEEKVQTLSKLAKKLGVCKERVRQLEKRALEKLRGMADEFHLAACEE